MPPTFLLFAAAIGLAFLSPIVAIAAVALIFSPPWRNVGIKMLALGFGGSLILAGLWMTPLIFGRPVNWHGIDIVVGVGFSLGSGGMLLWEILRKVRSNTRLQATPVGAPEPERYATKYPTVISCHRR